MKKTLQTAVLAASGIAVLGFAVTMVFPAQVLWLFSGDRVPGRLAGLGIHAMRLCTAMLPLVGFQIVSSGYFQAVGKPAQAMFLTLSRQVLLLDSGGLDPAALLRPRRRLDVAAGGRSRFVGLDGRCGCCWNCGISNGGTSRPSPPAWCPPWRRKSSGPRSRACLGCSHWLDIARLAPGRATGQAVVTPPFRLQYGHSVPCFLATSGESA